MNPNSEDQFHELFAQTGVNDDSNKIESDDESAFESSAERHESEDDGYLEDFQNTLEDLLTTQNDSARASKPKPSRGDAVFVRSVTDEAVDAKQVQEEISKLGAIKVKGSAPPLPVTNWLECGLSDDCLSMLNDMRCVKPFAVQCITIPALMDGRDVLVIAETGSGKTLSYCIPVIRRVTSEKQRSGNHKGPFAVIVVCSRELADQVGNLLQRLTNRTGLVIRIAHGGNDVAHDMAEISTSCDILIGCPGRIVDICLKRKGAPMLSKTALIAFDEADRLFDEGFYPQIEKICSSLREDTQKAMFSATMPGFIAKSAKKLLRNPLTITGGSRLGIPPTLEQTVEIFQKEDDRFFRLLQILGEHVNQRKQVLIFVEKRNDLEELYMSLQMHGYASVTIYSEMDIVDRGLVLAEFTDTNADNPHSILVATGLAARGLDIADLSLVINYTTPPCLEEYVHRVGRTARGGKRGKSVTFLLQPYENAHSLYLLQALRDGPQDAPFLDELQKIAQEVSGDKELILWTPKDSYRSYSGHGYAFDREERKKSHKRKRMQQKETMRALGMGGGPILPPSDASKGALIAIDEASKEKQAAPVVSNIMKSTGKEIALKSGDAKTRAMAIAAAINEAKELEATKSAHSVRVPINDFSIRLRRMVTNRSLLSDLIDDGNVEVSFSGEYIKGQASSDKKLHLVLSAPSKAAAEAAALKVDALLRHEAKFEPI